MLVIKKQNLKGIAILISSRVSWSLIEKCLDLNGRYLFLKGYLDGIKVTLATVYAPNLNQDSFLNIVLPKLAEFAEGKLILGGGDFNIPLDPRIDTSVGTSSVPGSVKKRILRKL